MFAEHGNKPSVYVEVSNFVTNLQTVHFLNRALTLSGYQYLKYVRNRRVSVICAIGERYFCCESLNYLVIGKILSICYGCVV